MKRLDEIINLIKPRPYYIVPEEKLNIEVPPGGTVSILEAEEEGALIAASIWANSDLFRVILKFDTTQWDFLLRSANAMGMVLPYMPGGWLARADPVTKNWVFVFSSGSVGGFPYFERIRVDVRNEDSEKRTIYAAGVVRKVYK